MKKYRIWFDFDNDSDPPKVQILDEKGFVVIEVLEEPAYIGEDTWQAGPLALRLLELLNKEE